MATLTPDLQKGELDAPRELRSAQRVGAVVQPRDYLADRDNDVQITDIHEPSPPERGNIALAEKIDADLIVLGGGRHGFIDNLLTGHTAKSIGKRSQRPVTILPKTSA